MAQSHSELLQFKMAFRQGSSAIDTAFMDNARQIAAFRARLDSLTGYSPYKVRNISIRSTTSPEGGYLHNIMLSQQRAENLKTYLQTYPALREALYSMNSRGTDWEQLAEYIRTSEGLDCKEEILRIIRVVPEREILADSTIRQKRLQAIIDIDQARSYDIIYDRFFHDMRMAQAYVECILEPISLPRMSAFSYAGARASVQGSAPARLADTGSADKGKGPKSRRLPLLSVKTNLLFDFATFYPGYGWAPSPNIAIEYYPKRGHWTVGASLDCPWWKKPQEHKYFQVRNYQIEARRYFRPAGSSRPQNSTKLSWTGWYLSAYVHGGLFGIGLSDKVGGQGEGVGAGIGAGYVLPLSRNGHWKLEFSLQAGYSYAWYDRYIYGNPVTGQLNGLYYYDWAGQADDFVPRLYRKSWIGPTRVGITLSYDIVKRKSREVIR